MAAGIVGASLRNLRREDRRLPWVVEAIAALGVLQSTLAEQLVEEILRARRFVILKSWPWVCRRAALGAKAKFQDARAEALAQGSAR
jgi:hypothetical protein